jgi:hypothetical protein
MNSVHCICLNLTSLGLYIKPESLGQLLALQDWGTSPNYPQLCFPRMQTVRSELLASNPTLAVAPTTDGSKRSGL